MATEQELLKVLERDTVDTSTWARRGSSAAKDALDRAYGMLTSIAVPQEDGTLRSWHVTDDPENVIGLIETKTDFYARKGDLCGGLYVSDVPHFWEVRSDRKWDFIQEMSPDSRRLLYEAVYQRLAEEARVGYITANEWQTAQRIMAQAMDSDYWSVLTIVANQPFNVDIPRLAKDLALAKPFQPHHVQVDFVGRYLEFNTQRAVEANEKLLKLRHGSLEGLTRTDLCDMLKSYGWDGVYTKASMGTNPELVIWSGEKIVRFGDYAAASPSLSGRRAEAIWIPGQRFEASINAPRTLVTLHDNFLKGTFADLTVDEVFELQRMVREILGPPRKSRRFETKRLYNIPQIYDRASDRHFRYMKDKEIADLRMLIDQVLEVMNP